MVMLYFSALTILMLQPEYAGTTRSVLWCIDSCRHQAIYKVFLFPNAIWVSRNNTEYYILLKDKFDKSVFPDDFIDQSSYWDIPGQVMSLASNGQAY